MKFKNIFKNKSSVIILFMIVLGIALIIFGNLYDADSKEENSKKEYTSREEYIDIVENKIKCMIAKVTGGGDICVIVSIDDSGESVYAKNINENSQNKTSEKTEVQKNEEYVVIKDGADSSVVVVKTVYPKIRGVAVVCQNGSDFNVQKEIINLISCAYGISSARIYVSGTN